MSKITFLTQEAAFKALKVVKSPKVRIAVLLIALVAPGFALAGDHEGAGGG